MLRVCVWRHSAVCRTMVMSDIVAQNLPVAIDALVPSNAQKAT